MQLADLPHPVSTPLKAFPMSRLMRLIPAVLMMACAVPAQASLINGDFELGDLSGWDIIGNSQLTDASFMSGPLEGSYSGLVRSVNTTSESGKESADDISTFLGLDSMALDDKFTAAADGAAFAQTFDAMAGDVIELTFRFLTSEFANEPEFNDTAFYSLTPTSVVGDDTNVHFLADTFTPLSNSNATDYNLETGVLTTDIVIMADGEYRIGFGVLNIFDDSVRSALMIDVATSSTNPSVPEPGTIAIWSVLGVAGFGYSLRRRAKKAKAA